MQQYHNIDWAILKRALLFFAVCLVFSGALISSSYYFRQNVQQAFNENNRRLQKIKRLYAAVDQEEQLIEQYYPAFLNAIDTGLLGQEHRLDWIEVLHKAGEIIRLPSLHFEIASQRKYTPTFTFDNSIFDIHVSEMKLRIGMLHEGDLIQLLNTLEQDARGRFSVSQCQLQRVGLTLQGEPDRSNINANCVLHWFTVSPTDGSKLELL